MNKKAIALTVLYVVMMTVILTIVVNWPSTGLSSELGAAALVTNLVLTVFLDIVIDDKL